MAGPQTPAAPVRCRLTQVVEGPWAVDSHLSVGLRQTPGPTPLGPRTTGSTLCESTAGAVDGHGVGDVTAEVLGRDPPMGEEPPRPGREGPERPGRREGTPTGGDGP